MNERQAKDEEPASTSSRRTTALFFAAVVLHGLAYLLLLPPWMGEDEPWHLEAIHHVAQGHLPHLGGGRSLAPEEFSEAPITQLLVRRRFPSVEPAEVAELQRRLTAELADHAFWERIDWSDPFPGATSFHGPWASTAAGHPPLYYLLAGGAVGLSGIEDVGTQLMFCRLLSLLAYLGVVMLALSSGRAIFRDETLALLVAGVVAWLPIHARQAGVVNNDVMAKLVVSAVFCMSVRIVAGDARPWERWGALVVCLLGVATKTTTLAAFGILALALLLPPGRRRGTWPAIAGLTALVLGALVVWRTQLNHAVPWSLDEVREQLGGALTLETWTRLGTSFVGTFNGNGRALSPGIVAAVGFVFLALAAFAAWRLVRGRSDARAPLLLCFGAVLLQLSLIAFHGYGVGRYLVPTVIPIAAVSVSCVTALAPGKARRAAIATCVVLLLIYDALYLWTGLIEHQYLGWRA